MTSGMRLKVVVAGCGFAGSAAVKSLAREAGQRIDLIAIDKQTSLYNYPILPRLLVESVSRDKVEIPLARYFRGINMTLRNERIREVDAVNRVIRSDNAELAFDILILGLGSRALPVEQDSGVFVYYPKSSRHLEKLSEAVKSAAYQISEKAPALDNRNYQIAVIGGGLTGVEFASALREAANCACDRFGVPPARIEVSIYERTPHLGGSVRQSLSHALRNELKLDRIRVVTDCDVKRVIPGRLVTSKGLNSADTVVCCIGAKPNLRLEIKGLTSEKDGLPVDAYLRSIARSPVFLIGDGMVFHDVNGPRLDLRKAHRASAQGKLVATNVLRTLNGLRPLSYSPRNAPTLVMLGSRKGVFDYAGWTASGRLVGYAKRWLESPHRFR